MVIFGAAGDLSRRKLLPALYSLAQRELLADGFAVLGISRQRMDTAQFRAMLRQGTGESEEIQHLSRDAWSWLEERIHYVPGDIADAASYAAISTALETIERQRSEQERNRLFYLAVPPSVFDEAVRNIDASGLAFRTGDESERPWVRLVVEKPFGRSLQSARELNAMILDRFGEHQVYRIDHYLGKETVQNLLVFRFGNSICEPLWNRQYIERVNITAAETIGVEGRGAYYEESGVLRDMFQNHLLQLLTLAAMETPISFAPDAVRDEKVKVLRSICPIVTGGTTDALRAQYGGGELDGRQVPAYRAEAHVARDSVVPTFAALRITIANWRWQGVPFFLRSGKRLAQRTSEIEIVFRSPPQLRLGPAVPLTEPPNVLTIRVQPDEGIALRMQVKTPGTIYELTPELEVTPVEMDFRYARVFGELPAPAYETLLLDTMIGDATLFTRSDEVEMAWHVIDPLIQHWEADPPADVPTYPPGSWGPPEAERLFQGS